MKGKKIIKKLSLWLQSLVYMSAGVNHFIHPGSYIAMIPPYIPCKTEANILVGIIEFTLGLLLLVWIKQRKLVSIGIVLLLIAILPAHIYHIQMNGHIPGFGLVLPLWGAWLRLILQLVLIAWAWSVRRYK